MAFHPAVLGATDLADIEAVLGHLPAGRPSIRLHAVEGLDAFLAPGGSVGSVALSLLGTPARPVRAILFDKTATTNWALGWHQDRTIAVAERVDVPGFAHWSVKAGMIHVEPPDGVMRRMATIRVHLDAVSADNAPLLASPGTHRLGRIAESDVVSTVERHGVVTCLAGAGDMWIYAMPILHASDRALRPHRRRVLQVDYAVSDLPGWLRWLGI